ncbi:MAG: hypothetical protein IKE59_08935 [Erysipelotrichaceae bacterium]|nr:hypothetical protein [Erysipelotrichaceae bacterium]
MLQYSKFGMTTLHITAGHQYPTHAGTTVVDVCGIGSGIEPLNAPFDCKAVAWDPANGNTIVFQNTEPVILPVGTFENVCFRCTHMNDSELYSLFPGGTVIGKTFSQGDICYYEGTAGNAQGNHIHMEFAIGSYQSMGVTNGTNKYLITDLSNSSPINNGKANLYFPQAVFIDPTITTEVISTDGSSSYYTNQYTFTLINGLTATNYYLSQYDTSISAVSTDLKMKFTSLSGRLRTSKVNGNTVAIIYSGEELTISTMYSNIESDNYRWAYGIFHSTSGYFQYDPEIMHPYGRIGSNAGMKLKMKLESTPAAIRVSQTGSYLTTIPMGEDVDIDELNDSMASDGYRWVRVRYQKTINGNTYNYAGWMQYDPELMYPHHNNY